MDNDHDWTAKRMRFIQALRHPTDSQKLLVELYSLPSRNSRQEREFCTLIRLERIEERAEQARAIAKRIVFEKKTIERKNRTDRLFQLGELVERAGCAQLDPEVLLGALLHIAEQLRAGGIKPEVPFQVLGQRQLGHDAVLVGRDA